MSASQSFHSTHLPSITNRQFFDYLCTLFNHANERPNDESLLYAPISYILTSLCYTARIGSQDGTCFASYPQNKIGAKKKTWRIPDFLVLALKPRPVTDGSDGAGGNKIGLDEGCTPVLNFGENGVLIWEIKPAPRDFIWSGPEMTTRSQTASAFIKHLRQIREQIRFARHIFHQRPVYALLSVGVWFILIKSPAESQDDGLPSFNLNFGTDDGNYICLYEPTPIFESDWSDFTPEFLLALQMPLESLDYDTEVGLAPVFVSSRRTVITETSPTGFKETLEEYLEQLTIDTKFARGEESDSTQPTSNDSPFVSGAQPSQASPAVTRSRPLSQARASMPENYPQILFGSHPVESDEEESESDS
ncbi:hypothetical protein AGABI2DRAFT_123302 [Agaricus bisporus var. bisporus H97]|uniref:hypothetical protein n=1 Tax=Agaricus bisporus var. bisporus (strain H97 / ATCC MYA-4626 / FGSC 10389) TaxID=936046 RepID=UPI00029F5783|nr:hypothetical protein AGABI2DRAFT_123302 [Agaricus bisporus var. bisporus H97]EKV41824.1 hypothetical protein AGABI2DRAFT_123302 [Agaricus bisporus var. bisporus H97]